MTLQTRTIHHTVIGKGRPLLLVNGLYQWRQLWTTVARELSDSFRCITFDFPNQNILGNGEDADPDFDDPRQFEDHVLALLRQLDVDPAETIGFGLSFGASLLRQLHLGRGVEFGGLVLAGAHDPGLTPFYKLYHDCYGRMLEAQGSEHYLSTFTLWFFSQEWWAINPDAHAMLMARYRTTFANLDAVKALFRAAAADFSREVPAGRYRCPTTYVTGDKDVFTPAHYMHDHARERGAALKVVDGGHAFMGEDPGLAVRVIRECAGAAAPEQTLLL